MIRGLAIAAGVGSVVVAAAVRTAPADERGTLVDNASVSIERSHLVAGATTGIAPVATPALIVQLTPGDIDLTIGSRRASGPREPGAIAFVPSGSSALARNIASRAATDVVVIRFKPGRVAAPSMPSTDAPPGITRTPLLDNADTRVVRVQFSSDGREPIHTHPYDLITLQISPGRVEILDGEAKTTERRDAGFAKFVPRDHQHAYASADPQPFEILSVAIK